jgi:6-phosphogluconolactonase (cycloisomerase 2 family)
MLKSRMLWAGCVALSLALWASCGGGDQTGIVYLVSQADQNECSSGVLCGASVGSYQINLRTGVLNQNSNALQPIGNPVPTGAQPTILVFNPSKTDAFVANKTSNSISILPVNHDGTLGTGTTVQLRKPATNPAAMAVDPAGKFLFVTNLGVPGDPNCGSKGTNPSECQAGISVFSVGSNSLTEVTGSPFAVLTQQQTTTYGAPVVPAGVAVANSGNFLYVTEQSNDVVLGFSFDGSTGVLTPLPSTLTPPLWPVLVGASPSGVFSPPIGNFLYVTNLLSNNIFQFKIQSDGSLTTVVGSPIAAGIGPTVMFSDPNGKYLLAVGTGSNQILGYRVNQVTGALTALNPPSISTGSSPVAATIRSNGIVNGDYWIIVSNNVGNSVSTIDLNNSTGGMTILPQISAPQAPFGIGSR